MRIIAIITAAVVVVAAMGLGALRFSPAVQDRAIDRAMERQIAAGQRDFSDVDLHVVFCGSGSPFIDVDRANACTAVIAGGRLFIFDAGPRSTLNLRRFGLPLDRLEAVFLTHYHSDHIGGLGELAMQSWAAGRLEPYRVIGPTGVQQVSAGFVQAYQLDRNYRVAHHGEEAMPGRAMSFIAQEVGDGEEVVFLEGVLKVTAFAVDHSPIDPAFGYRIDYGGRSVVISGDTVAHENVEKYSKEADVLVHEALAERLMQRLIDALEGSDQPRLAHLVRDTLDYHTTPIQAAELANRSKADLLVLTHVVPPLRNQLLERMYLRGVDDVRDDGVLVAKDGLYLRLSRESEELAIKWLK